jgi:hypothetical protein
MQTTHSISATGEQNSTSALNFCNLFWKPRQQPQQPEPIEIPYEDEADIIHTPEHPFCGDPTCGCADDPILIGEIAKRVASGELIPNQATGIVRGKQW